MKSSNKKTNLIEAGIIVKLSGLNGRLKVRSYLQSSDLIESLKIIFVKQENQEAKPFKLKKIRSEGKSFLINLDGVEDSESAKKFLGCEVLITSDNLKALPDGEYYWKDIIGLDVYTEDDRLLGTVESIIPTGSNDIYVCTGGEREILLPAIADVIREIDVSKGRLVVRLLEGL